MPMGIIGHMVIVRCIFKTLIRHACTEEETYITGALVMPNLNREEQTDI